MATAVPQHPAGSLVAPVTLPRRAMWALWGGLAAGAALSGAGALAYLWPHAAIGLGDAGAAVDYAVGQARYFAGTSDAPVADIARRAGYYVVRRADGFVAFASVCTHQVAGRCRLVWRETVQPQGGVGVFSCPCHGGAWRPDTGDPITNAPAFPYSFIPHSVPALPLISLPVAVAHGRVRVGLAAVIKYRQSGQPPLLARWPR